MISLFNKERRPFLTQIPILVEGNGGPIEINIASIPARTPLKSPLKNRGDDYYDRFLPKERGDDYYDRVPLCQRKNTQHASILAKQGLHNIRPPVFKGKLQGGGTLVVNSN
jgi:hypothetical protein